MKLRDAEFRLKLAIAGGESLSLSGEREFTRLKGHALPPEEDAVITKALEDIVTARLLDKEALAQVEEAGPQFQALLNVPKPTADIILQVQQATSAWETSATGIEARTGRLREALAYVDRVLAGREPS